MDYQKMAESLDAMRETTAAGFMTDGFTEEQARTIVTGFFAAITKMEEQS